ncbi:caspase-3-like [Gigantopelta aegis]|uniref:caspase-3-like n=1 Tax=Gigantopelta aegis TaxID=1735272 RepID=UPI001B88C6DA|nr:caspase-3-like [Gigantopelta aegis]
MERNIMIYVVGPEGVGKSTLVKSFTKGKVFRKRVEGFRCWATSIKTRDTDDEQIDIYEFRGFKGNVSAGPSLTFWTVHVLIVMCTQHSLSESCKNFKFDFWRRRNTQVHLVQNIRSSEIRDSRTLETEGKHFGLTNTYQLRVSSKGEVRQLFKKIIGDLHQGHPDFPRDSQHVSITLDDSGYRSKASTAENQRPVSNNILQKYEMGVKPRGTCIIINNEDFGSLMEKRTGSDKDKERLRELFSDLDFDVHIFTNQTRSDILDILKRESTKDHSAHSCFVCCILSHGAQEVVFGTDGNAVDISELVAFYEGDQCRGLLGKPKIFIIQACQGNKQRPGVETLNGSDGGLRTDVSVCKTMPVDADFLIACATTSGSLAFRHQRDGSHYISTLVEKIRQNLAKSLTDVLTMVNSSMAQQDYEFEGQRSKQIGCYKSTLRKQVVFGGIGQTR